MIKNASACIGNTNMSETTLEIQACLISLKIQLDSSLQTIHLTSPTLAVNFYAIPADTRLFEDSVAGSITESNDCKRKEQCYNQRWIIAQQAEQKAPHGNGSA